MLEGAHSLVVPLTHVAATASVEGKMSKGLRKLLKKVYSEDLQDQLAVADAKLGSAIKVHPCGSALRLAALAMQWSSHGDTVWWEVGGDEVPAAR